MRTDRQAIPIDAATSNLAAPAAPVPQPPGRCSARRHRGLAGVFAAAGLLALGCDGREPAPTATEPASPQTLAEAAPAPAAPAPAPAPAPDPDPTDEDPLVAVLRTLPPVADAATGEPIPLPAPLAEAFGLIEAGRTDVARVRLRRRLAIEPEDGFARFLFGLTYHRERRYSEAGPWLAEAIARVPAYDPPYYFAAWGRYYLGEPDLAGELWTRHLALRPDAADSHFGLGLLDLEAGRPAEAEDRFRRAIALEQDLPGRERSVAKAWARLGDALADQDRVPEAREALERAVGLWPDHHEAWSRLARIARQLGDGDAATRANAEAEAALARTRAAGDARP